MRHGIVCSLAIALVCACQPSAGAKVPPGKAETPSDESSLAPSQPMTSRELGKIIGVTCKNPDTGDRCVGGDYDVELWPDCSDEGQFAGVVASKGALLIDKAPPDDSVRRAMLSQGQFVCIQAIARAGASASYYYVVAVPTSVANCRATSPCDKYGNRKVNWLIPHKGKVCREIAPGRFDGDCAEGWVRESNLEILNGK